MLGCVIGAVVGAYFSGIAACDFLEYKQDIQIFSQTQRTAKCYDWFEQYLEPNYNKIDYSEGLFEGNYELSLEDATEKKYAYIFNKLGLQPGMKLLDAGCGTGNWMKYCKDRGVDVVGLTLSEEQQKVGLEKGLDVRVGDYRVMDKTFINSFDRITALGSSEHVCSSLGSLKGDTAAVRCNQTRIDTWNLFHEYLKPSGKVYITVLTINENAKWSSMDWMQAYFLERHYGGYYSKMRDIEHNVVPHTKFKMTDLQDKTADYHWSSVVNKDHFGHWTINWGKDTSKKITYAFNGLTSDLYFIHHWMYYFMDTWMWQFGGYQTTPLTEEQVNNSPVHLKYFMLEATD